MECYINIFPQSDQINITKFIYETCAYLTIHIYNVLVSLTQLVMTMQNICKVWGFPAIDVQTLAITKKNKNSHI